MPVIRNPALGDRMSLPSSATGMSRRQPVTNPASSAMHGSSRSAKHPVLADAFRGSFLSMPGGAEEGAIKLALCLRINSQCSLNASDQQNGCSMNRERIIRAVAYSSDRKHVTTTHQIPVRTELASSHVVKYVHKYFTPSRHWPDQGGFQPRHCAYPRCTSPIRQVLNNSHHRAQ